MSGKVVHFELPADDMARARQFYEKSFGWTIREEPGHGYALVSTVPTDKNGMPTQAGAINGGMLKRQEPIRQLVVTVDVDSIDQAVARIENAGGKIIRGKQPVGQIGFAAYFRDPEGNVLGLWENAKAAPKS